jgi:divinyl protochlorophyllide a 8-vinyl-reductase
MEHRIPGAARRALMALPASLAAPLLARAIARNAWTFAGSGAFEMVSTRPPVFLIRDNPVVRGEVSRTPLCHWHAAVFQRLFGALVHPGYRAHETECCAMGAGACRFELLRS